MKNGVTLMCDEYSMYYIYNISKNKFVILF